MQVRIASQVPSLYAGREGKVIQEKSDEYRVEFLDGQRLWYFKSQCEEVNTNPRNCDCNKGLYCPLWTQEELIDEVSTLRKKLQVIQGVINLT